MLRTSSERSPPSTGTDGWRARHDAVVRGRSPRGAPPSLSRAWGGRLASWPRAREAVRGGRGPRKRAATARSMRVGIFGEKGEGRVVGGSTVERFEALSEEHLDECARVLISASNEQPWNERWTPETDRAELLWTMSTPGFLGFASFDGEMCRFSAGYREQDDDREVFYPRTLCVRPGHAVRGVGSRLVKHLERTLDETGVRLVYLITHKGGRAGSL